MIKFQVGEPAPQPDGPIDTVVRWLSEHVPHAEGDFVAVLHDRVLGPFASDAEASHAAYREDPAAVAAIVQISEVGHVEDGRLSARMKLHDFAG